MRGTRNIQLYFPSIAVWKIFTQLKFETETNSKYECLNDRKNRAYF